VALATLGAVAIDGEGVFGATSTVAKGATRAVSEITEHKYGASAGRAVRDAGDTAGNVLRTAAHLTLLSGRAGGSAVAKEAAKNTAKVHVEEEALLRHSSSSNCDDQEAPLDRETDNRWDENTAHQAMLGSVR